MRTLRDFLTEEVLKHMPGKFQAGTFMLLEENEKLPGNTGMGWVRKLHVFSEEGLFIGTIQNPEYIPTKK